jgi:hypothetical protein
MTNRTKMTSSDEDKPIDGLVHYYTGSWHRPSLRCCGDESFEPILDGGAVAVCCTHCGATKLLIGAKAYKKFNPQRWQELTEEQKAEDKRHRRVLFRIRNAAAELSIPNCKVALLVRNADDSKQAVIVTDDNLGDVRDTINAIVDEHGAQDEENCG